MNKQNVTVASHKEKSTLVRPKFGPGMLLQHEDLDLMSTYTQELSRLMFRSLFGCGVICGLVVKTQSACGKIDVIVEAGVGLDCSGYPIYVQREQRFTLDDKCDSMPKGPLWVVLCGTTTCCAPRTSLCASDDDEATAVCTRERDGFEIRVVGGERPKCTCSCPGQDDNTTSGSAEVRYDKESICKCVDPCSPYYVDHYAGKCSCSCGDCSDCECKCILLARLKKCNGGETVEWDVDHSVRRFIRPVLMRDPQVEIERQQSKRNEEQSVEEAAPASVVKKGAKAKNGKVSL